MKCEGYLAKAKIMSSRHGLQEKFVFVIKSAGYGRLLICPVFENAQAYDNQTKVSYVDEDGNQHILVIHNKMREIESSRVGDPLAFVSDDVREKHIANCHYDERFATKKSFEKKPSTTGSRRIPQVNVEDYWKLKGKIEALLSLCENSKSVDSKVIVATLRG